MAKLVLHSYFRSSCSYRVRIALNWKQIKYEYKPVNLLKGEQIAEPYISLNPMGEVPALEVDGTILTQSLSIIEYLEEAYPDHPLLPRNDPLKRAKSLIIFEVRQVSEMIASGIQPVQNLRVLRKHGLEHKLEWGAWAINHGFKAVEHALSECSGKYCVGDEVSMADLCLVPQVYNANRFNVNLEEYPNIKRVYEALIELPEFKAADPVEQPDCPEEIKLEGKK